MGESWLFHLPIIDLVLKQVHASVILQPILQTSTEEACGQIFDSL